MNKLLKLRWVAIALPLSFGVFAVDSARANEPQLGGIPLACHIQIGPLDIYPYQAFNTYDLVSYASSQWRAIALAYLEAGDLERALELTEKLDEHLTDDRQETLIAIAEQSAIAGDYDWAMQLTKRINDRPAFAVKLLARVARHAEAAGANRAAAEKAWAEAMGALATLEPWERDRALVYLAVEQAAMARMTEALSLVQQIGDAEERDWASALIAVELVRLDRLDRALTLAASLQEPYYQSQALSRMAQQATVAQLEKILAQATAIANKTYRNPALAAIARRYITLQQFTKAQQIAQLLPKSDASRSALVAQYATAGRLDLALNGFSQLNNPLWRRSALDAIARQFAASDYPQALEFAAAQSSGEQQILALRAIAEQQTEVGQYQQALNLYDRALKLADTSRSHPPAEIHGIQSHFIPLLKCAQGKD